MVTENILQWRSVDFGKDKDVTLENAVKYLKPSSSIPDFENLLNCILKNDNVKYSSEEQFVKQ